MDSNLVAFIEAKLRGLTNIVVSLRG